MVTETDELAGVLDLAALSYPGLSRAQLLVRLAVESHHAASRVPQERRRSRLDALREHSGALTGVYGQGYHKRFRQKWPG